MLRKGNPLTLLVEMQTREGNGNALQYSCLENPMDGEVHGVTKSRTRLNDFTSPTATMENSVEIPSKTGNRTVIQPSNPTARHTQRGNQN